jgi:hypothetical protein
MYETTHERLMCLTKITESAANSGSSTKTMDTEHKSYGLPLLSNMQI